MLRGYVSKQACEYSGIYRQLGHPNCVDLDLRQMNLDPGQEFPKCPQCSEKAQWYLSKTTEPVYVKQT